jgi:site-specific DNA-methyltransferase (adenine-specific)
MREPVVIGNATLYLGDCMEILPTLAKVDALITDPPYGIGELWDRPRKHHKGDSALCVGAEDWDATTNPDALQLAISKAGKAIVWGGNYYPLWPSRGYLVWDKMQKFSGAESELAWCSWAQAPRTFRYARAQLAHHETKEHPAQKPLPLMVWCLTLMPEATSILDPFMGSGTTGVAAAQCGKSFIGMERDPAYFEIACRRIEEAHKQVPLIPHESPPTYQLEIS